jgi:transcriptional regulator with XRE-family HTH domain
MNLRKISGLGGRPYPLDKERRKNVIVALAEKDLNISELAKNLGLSRSLISNVISGRRRSEKTEKRIAEYLGKDADELFPPRTPEEIGKMRKAERGMAA